MPFFNPMQNQQNLLDELSRRLFQERAMGGGMYGGGMQPTANLGGNPIANAVSNISGMSLSPMEQGLMNMQMSGMNPRRDPRTVNYGDQLEQARSHAMNAGGMPPEVAARWAENSLGWMRQPGGSTARVVNHLGAPSRSGNPHLDNLRVSGTGRMPSSAGRR